MSVYNDLISLYHVHKKIGQYGRMPISLQFRLRTTKTSGQVMLYIRLRYDGVVANDYASGVQVPLSIWPALPADHPQSRLIALRIAKIRAEHDQIELTMQLEGITPTAASIRQAWLDRDKPKTIFTLLNCFDEFVAYLRSEQRKPATLKNYALARKHLSLYLSRAKLTTTPAGSFRSSFGYSWHDYLCKSMSAGTAKTFIGFLGAAYRYALRYDKVDSNPFSGLRIKGNPVKPIHFLTPIQLITLSCLPLTGTADDVRSWALLMCYTGLDYMDALEVVNNLGNYYKTGPHGETIVYQRLKGKRAAQWGICEIPILPETRELLTTALDWKRPRLRNLNDYLNKIGKDMNLEFSFSSKVCRKTGGAVMLLRYKNMYVVQKVLGHKSITITERHYVSISPTIVHEAMERYRY